MNDYSQLHELHEMLRNELLDLDALERFRSKLSNVFACESGKVHGRKPSLAMRLYSTDRTTMISATPYFCYTTKMIDAARSIIEVFKQDPAEIESTKVFYCRPALYMELSLGSVEFGWVQGESIATTATAVNEVAATFATDPAAVIARCKDHCTMCRRNLTDGASRSRGFGPECAQRLGSVGFLRPLFD